MKCVSTSFSHKNQLKFQTLINLGMQLLPFCCKIYILYSALMFFRHLIAWNLVLHVQEAACLHFLLLLHGILEASFFFFACKKCLLLSNCMYPRKERIILNLTVLSSVFPWNILAIIINLLRNKVFWSFTNVVSVSYHYYLHPLSLLYLTHNYVVGMAIFR